MGRAITFNIAQLLTYDHALNECKLPPAELPAALFAGDAWQLVTEANVPADHELTSSALVSSVVENKKRAGHESTFCTVPTPSVNTASLSAESCCSTVRT